MVTIIPMNKKELSGEVVSYSLHTTGYGQAVIASTSIGVCYVGFGEREKVLNDLKKRYGGATVQEKYLPLHQHVLNHLEKGDASDLRPRCGNRFSVECLECAAADTCRRGLILQGGSPSHW